MFRSENPLTGTASVKDAWKEISDVLNENKAASTQTPFTVTFIVLISIHFLKKRWRIWHLRSNISLLIIILSILMTFLIHVLWNTRETNCILRFPFFRFCFLAVKASCLVQPRSHNTSFPHWRYVRCHALYEYPKEQ